MLTKDDLMTQKVAPNVKDISLKLYKEFSEEILLKQCFVYYFTDKTTMQVEFREWGIYHMLSIQHIDNSINKNKLFQEINNGLELSSFKKDKAIKNRYKNEKERIAIFSCLYNTLKEANVFYLPSGKVKNSKSVKVNYIIFSKIGTKGMNIGLKKVGEIYVPMTILISKPSKKEIYLEETVRKEVDRLEIIEIKEKQ